MHDRKSFHGSRSTWAGAPAVGLPLRTGLQLSGNARFATIVGRCYDDIGMSVKQRLSASVDADILAAAQAAVLERRAPNISAWVNEALRRQVEHDRRMRALDHFIAAYEAEHGVISDEEIREASRNTRARAVVVRGRKRATGALRKRRAGAK